MKRFLALFVIREQIGILLNSLHKKNPLFESLLYLLREEPTTYPLCNNQSRPDDPTNACGRCGIVLDEAMKKSTQVLFFVRFAPLLPCTGLHPPATLLFHVPSSRVGLTNVSTVQICHPHTLNINQSGPDP